jgi:hypothetical protein
MLLAFINDIPNNDKLTISMTTDAESVYVASGDSAIWTDEYQNFVGGVDDEISIVVKIEKSILNGSINVYNLESFCNFLKSSEIEAHLHNFSKLFCQCGNHLAFRLLDTNGSLHTNSIVFSDNEVQWNSSSREDQIKCCDDASVFLDRNIIALIPQDFIVQRPIEGEGLGYISSMFTRLSRVLAFIYVANTASVVNGKAILQFNVAVKGDEYSLNDLSENEVITQIYTWAFCNNNPVEMASIARKIINIYCKTQNDVLKINEKVLYSIKSDYLIYSKNHVDRYIETKNKISEFIVDSTKQMQELSHDMSSAIRNNLVAIIVFVLTVLLTDSIDITTLTGSRVPLYVVWVCGFFSMASILYLIATLFMANQRWEWLKQSYIDLKDNYRGTLDDKDIDEAFGHDEPLKTTGKQYGVFRKRIVCVWIAMIVLMIVLSGFFAVSYYSNVEKTFNEAETPVVSVDTTNKEETAISEELPSINDKAETMQTVSPDPTEINVESSN